jgi:hypothetical protein
LHTDKLVAEKPSESELDRYGLKSPAFKAVVTIKNREGSKSEHHVYLFGKETEDKASRYAQQDGRDVVFLVRSNVVDPLQKDFADPTVLTFDVAKVKGMKLTGWQSLLGSPHTLDLERKSGSDWVAKAPPGFQVNPSQAEGFLTSLNGLRAVRFVAHKSGAKPEHKLDIKDGALEVELTLEGQKDPIKLTVGAHSDPDKGYFARSSQLEGDVFLVPEDRFKKVLEKPAYFQAEAAK